MVKKITVNQREKIFEFMKNGIESMNLRKDDAEIIIKQGEEFQSEFKKLALRYTVSNEHAHEEVRSRYTYPTNYKLKKIEEQVERLLEIFPHLNGANLNIAKKKLPAIAEGWFAIPRWEKIAPTYGEAVEIALKFLKESRDDAELFSHIGYSFKPSKLRQSTKTKFIFEIIGNRQKDYDILVVPAQFGMRHRGRSVRRALDMMNAHECGLGAFAVSIMLICNPSRLLSYHNLWIDCAGDKFAPEIFAGYTEAPGFVNGASGIEFDAFNIGLARPRFGSASACLPQR